MATPPKQHDSANLDLSARVRATTTVTGSPAGATETIVATLPALPDLFVTSGVLLVAYAAFTIGTNGVGATFKIRRTDASGTTVVSSGVVNAGAIAATELMSMSAVGFDTGPTLPGQVYVATLTIASGSAASTVSAVSLAAVVV